MAMALMLEGLFSCSVSRVLGHRWGGLYWMLLPVIWGTPPTGRGGVDPASLYQTSWQLSPD